MIIAPLGRGEPVALGATQVKHRGDQRRRVKCAIKESGSDCFLESFLWLVTLALQCAIFGVSGLQRPGIKYLRVGYKILHVAGDHSEAVTLSGSHE